MFTGIVRDVGRVVSFDGARLVVETSVTGAVGDSIAIDGICLTVVSAADGRLTFDVVPETLGRVKRFGDEVNVEPPLRAGDPLGGHFVQGHVDAVGRVQSVEAEGDGLRVFVEAPEDVLRYCVEKGSVAVDGVALTVAEVADGAIAVALVPHTLAATTLATLAPGRAVNLEADMLAKYVERALQGRRE
ncbi:MAG TPA: riboflavin synthase [Gaiellaceae bacterium]|nr:riboflavin synthase [Gaiellaceae bacterium]HLF68334.1 riboflavin synthase [Gaiellaceae bacterium]